MSSDATPAPEELVRILLDTVPCGVVHVGVDGSIKAANSEALRVLGVRYDDLTKRFVNDFDPTTVREDGSPCPATEYPVSRALATGEPQPAMTIGVVRPDGEISWAVFRANPTRGPDGVLTGAVVSFVDITERRRAEEMARRGQVDWSLLAANHPDFVIIVGRDGYIQSINRVLPEYELAKVIGTCGWSYVHEDYASAWKESLAKALETRAPVKIEVRAPGPGGETAWYEAAFIPLAPQTPDRPIERVLCVAHDITVQRATIADVAERERLASVGLLSASVAHEIMNPLTYVLANLDFVLSDRCPPGPRMQTAIESAREGAARMHQTVRDLRMLGREGGESLFYVNVGAVLETALRMAGHEVAKNVAVSVELAPTPDVVASDSRLCQVFINLLINASQSMAERPIGERRIDVHSSSEERSGFVGISITDTGVGIPPERLQRIFEAFYTTKRSGTGLGLSISKELVERMGGRIDVVSEIGRGTTFTVWLSTSLPPTASSSSA